MEKLRGLGVALATPFDVNGEIDFKSILKLLKHTSVKGGADYLVLMGSTGEATTITTQEQEQILAFIIKHNSANLPILFGLGGNNSAALVHRLKTLNLSGVTAILSSSPAYNRPSQDGIVAHFNYLADNAPKPLILYNVPARTCSNMEAKTTLKLASHPNIIGIKEASGNLSQIKNIVDAAPKDFFVISGDDMQTTDIISMGGIGVISVLANAFPREFRKIVDSAANKNNTKDSTSLNAEILLFKNIDNLMYLEGNPTGIKELLAQLNICTNKVRLPLVSATSNLQKMIKNHLDNFK